jgi:glycosyltransferase involved in cell wall biosynthesis
MAFDGRYVQDHFPGIGRYAYNLVAALAALPDGPELTLFYNPALPDRRYNLSGLAASNPDRVKLVPTMAQTFSSGEQWQLYRPAMQGGFSLWHAPYYIRPYFLPLPSVLTAYDVTAARLPELLPSRKARLAFGLTTRLAFRTSRRIIAISQSAARDIELFYKVNPEKIRVVPLGVSPDFHPLNPPAQTVARASLGLSERYLLYMGINKPHKNLARLLEAFKLYRERSSDDIRLILAGKEDPRYAAPLRQVAEQLNLTPYVRFWGEIAEFDLPRLYACASLFVFPSLQEGFGLPVLEAMACGTAVACADNSSLPEVAGDAAILFPAENVNAIADAIALGLQKQAELSEQGLARARLFTWQRTAELTLEVYREFMA